MTYTISTALPTTSGAASGAVAILPDNRTTVTASAVPGTTGLAVVDGTTLTWRQEGITLADGNVVSLGFNGLVDSTTTALYETLAGSPTAGSIISTIASDSILTVEAGSVTTATASSLSSTTTAESGSTTTLSSITLPGTVVSDSTMTSTAGSIPETTLSSLALPGPPLSTVSSDTFITPLTSSGQTTASLHVSPSAYPTTNSYGSGSQSTASSSAATSSLETTAVPSTAEGSSQSQAASTASGSSTGSTSGGPRISADQVSVLLVALCGVLALAI